MWFRKPPTTVGTGQHGEALALDYLRGLRYTIVATNYRRSFGEIDIIAKDRDTLVFVEVKSRRSSTFGSPAEAVDARKQRQLSRIAQEYLVSHQLAETPARFDVIAVYLHGNHQPATIEHIRNAFELVL
jgi:putative endonuclease